MINIRLANEKDLSTVEQLAREIWPVAYDGIVPPQQLDYMLDLIYNNEALRNQLLVQQHTFLMVEQDGKPVGFAAYSTVAPGVSKLHKLYVHQSTQGQGLGKKLVDHIIAQLQQGSFHTLRLNVNRYNKARFFYEKLGFIIMKEEDVDIGSGYFMIDYVMEKKL
ncbi:MULTISPECIES: GNAT family N-acetyltransferase [Niastella]|uniref:GNAT family N-acetyltransferase n=1 Tax=Niastella soli TaxID=2821487 RepID=A0ABS3Z335_9BACT|nr:GNAT family N-acetyltransferase [Niastella soli]MBO9204571.1 GNAT family N-acetyltransferase [Niastella soli]